MAQLTKKQRHEIARTRIARALRAQTAATMRTLEMKISDAGPNPQRVDPHYLTDARKELQSEQVVSAYAGVTNWYYLTSTPAEVVQRRLAELEPVQRAYQDRNFTLRLGDALEIAVFRSLRGSGLPFFGAFPTLDQQDDSKKHPKDEPPNNLFGRVIPGKKQLDFLTLASNNWIGIECKNIREWLYPDGSEVRELVSKCLHLDCVPVMVARRIQFATFAVFNKCGVVFHQTFNQRVPSADAELAANAMHKDSLGYFDIRLGNVPDDRLRKFIGADMTSVIERAREAFDRHKDLLEAYCHEGMNYTEFAARVRRRSMDLNEDRDQPPPGFPDDGPF